MKQLKLNVATRQEIGRRQSQRLRTQGRVPAVMYGKAGSRALSILETELRQLMRSMKGSVALIEIHDDKGHKTLSLIQEISRHASNDSFLHVDLHEISANEKMRTTIPIRLLGESYGVKNENGVIEFLTHEVEVRCLPKDLPEQIQIDISELRLNQTIHISNLPELSGVEYMGEKATVIVICAEPTKEEESAPAGEAAAEGAAVPAGAEGAAAASAATTAAAPGADAKAKAKGK